jgi:hypothetical protein
MGGFEIAGDTYVFNSTFEYGNSCLCRGVYGFIDESDEKIMFENETLDIKEIIDKLSIDFQKYINKLIESHSKTNTNYTISLRKDFKVPSYWKPTGLKF